MKPIDISASLSGGLLRVLPTATTFRPRQAGQAPQENEDDE